MDEIIDLRLIISLLVPALITIVGWFIVNRVTTKRDRNNKKREKVVDYLIASYKVLTSIPHREEDKKPIYYPNLEDAIADIQLFGTEKQITLAKEVANIFAKEKSVELNPLIIQLRDDLRKELNLEELNDKTIIHFRISFKEGNK